MDIIKEADFRKEIKSAPKSAYLFFGEEDYMKSFALKAASEAISLTLLFQRNEARRTLLLGRRSA